MTRRNIIVNNQITPNKIPEIRFYDFFNYSQLSHQEKLLNSLVNCYQHVFEESWQEHYSKSHILKKLKNEIRGYACLRIIEDTNTSEVIGFCWAQHQSSAETISSINTIEYIRNQTKLPLENIIEDHKHAVYIHDLGIKNGFRHSIPLQLIIPPVIECVATLSDCRDILFWSIGNTCISHIANKISLSKYHQHGDIQFFRGALPMIYSK